MRNRDHLVVDSEDRRVHIVWWVRICNHSRRLPREQFDGSAGSGADGVTDPFLLAAKCHICASGSPTNSRTATPRPAASISVSMKPSTVSNKKVAAKTRMSIECCA